VILKFNYGKRSVQLSKTDFTGPASNDSKEEPHIQREIDHDKTGTIRRYLRLADTMLSDRDDDPSTAA